MEKKKLIENWMKAFNQANRYTDKESRYHIHVKQLLKFIDVKIQSDTEEDVVHFALRNFLKECYPNFHIAENSRDLYSNEDKVETLLLCLMYHVGVKCVHKYTGFIDKITKHLDANTQKYLTAFLQVLLFECPSKLDFTEDVVNDAYKRSAKNCDEIIQTYSDSSTDPNTPIKSSKKKYQEINTPSSWGTPRSSKSAMSSPSLYKSFSESPSVLLTLNEEKNQEIKKLREDLMGEEDRYIALEKEVNELRTKLKESTNKEKFKTVALSQYHEEIATKEEHVEKLESELLKIKDEMASYKKENVDLQSELDFFYKSSSANTKETLDKDKEIMGLKADVKYFLEKESSAEKELLKLTEENISLKTEILECKLLHEILQNQLKTFQSKTENLDTSMPSYPSLAEEMEPQVILDLKAELRNERDKIENLSLENNLLIQEVAQRKDDLTKIINEKSTIQNNYTKSLADIHTLREEVDNLSKQVVQNNIEIDNLSKDKQSLTLEITLKEETILNTLKEKEDVQMELLHTKQDFVKLSNQQEQFDKKLLQMEKINEKKLQHNVEEIKLLRNEKESVLKDVNVKNQLICSLENEKDGIKIELLQKAEKIGNLLAEKEITQKELFSKGELITNLEILKETIEKELQQKLVEVSDLILEKEIAFEELKSKDILVLNLEEEKSTIEKELIDNGEKLRLLLGEMEAVKKDVTCKDDYIKVLKQEKIEIKEELMRKAEVMGNLMSEKDVANKEIFELNKRVTSLEEEKSQLEKEIFEKSEEIHNLVKDKDTVSQTLEMKEKSITDMEESKANVEKELIQKSELIKGLLREKDLLNEVLATKEEQMKILALDKDAIQEKLVEISKVEDAESVKKEKELTLLIKDLEKAKSDHEKYIRVLDETNVDLVEKLTAAETQYSMLSKALETEKAAKAAEKQETIKSYEYKLQLLKGKMTEIANEEVQKRCKYLKEKINMQDKKIKEMNAELWDVGEKLLKEKETNRQLLIISKLRTDGELKERSSSLRTIEDSPTTLHLMRTNSTGNLRRDSVLSTTSCRVPTEQMTVTQRNLRRTTIMGAPPSRGRKFPLSSNSGRVFPQDTEDEVGEVFDSTFLDMTVQDAAATFQKADDELRRISILQSRNSLCPPHLQSSYPGETQTLNPALPKEDEIRKGLPVGSTDLELLLPKKKDKGQSKACSGSSNSLATPRNSITPRTVLKEVSDSNNTSLRRTLAKTPNRIMNMFTANRSRRTNNENIPVTPTGSVSSTVNTRRFTFIRRSSFGIPRSHDSQ